MRYVLSSLIALLASSAAATSCAELRPFAEATRTAALIVEADVLGYGRPRHPAGMPEYMDLQVQAVHKGTLTTKRLRVHGDNGLSGRRSVSLYPVKTRWIFVLTPSNAAASVRSQSEFAFPECTDPALAVVGSRVFGSTGQRFNDSFPKAQVPELIRIWSQGTKARQP